MAEAKSNNIEELASKAKDKIKAVASDASETAQHAADAVTDAIADGKEAIEGSARQVRARARAKSAIDHAADRAHDLADRGIAATFDSVEQARHAYGRYSRETTRYIRRQPVKSVLIAAGLGAALAGLLIGRISSRRDR